MNGQTLQVVMPQAAWRTRMGLQASREGNHVWRLTWRLRS